MVDTVLRTELLTDPLARDYAGMTDVDVAASLNTKNITVDVREIPPADFLRGMVKAEWDALSAADRNYLSVLLGNGPIDVSTGTQIRAALLAMFGVGSGTRANLLPLLTKSISRAEQLGLPFIKPGYVAAARA
jgi:hypothetical protein